METKDEVGSSNSIQIFSSYDRGIDNISIYIYKNYIHTHTHTYIHTYIHYITLHYITLHYITLHYITLHYITLHYITLHYITLHYITLHYITLHYIHIYIYHIYIYTRRDAPGICNFDHLRMEKLPGTPLKRSKRNGSF